MNAIYPLLVVSIRGESVTLNQGGDLLSEGDRYDVFKYGERIIDPYTKESLGRNEAYLGTIEITRVNPKTSTARVVESDVDFSDVFEPKGLVCRPLLDAKGAQSEDIKKIKATQTKRRESRDEDW